MRSPRFAYARLASDAESAVPQRNSRQRSSTRAAVVFKAEASNASWLSSVATRVKALTLEYDSAPDEKADAIAGKVFKGCATLVEAKTLRCHCTVKSRSATSLRGGRSPARQPLDGLASSFEGCFVGLRPSRNDIGSIENLCKNSRHRIAHQISVTMAESSSSISV